MAYRRPRLRSTELDAVVAAMGSYKRPSRKFSLSPARVGRKRAVSVARSRSLAMVVAWYC
jgi:hypothetical protein